MTDTARMWSISNAWMHPRLNPSAREDNEDCVTRSHTGKSFLLGLPSIGPIKVTSDLLLGVRSCRGLPDYQIFLARARRFLSSDFLRISPRVLWSAALHRIISSMLRKQPRQISFSSRQQFLTQGLFVDWINSLISNGHLSLFPQMC